MKRTGRFLTLGLGLLVMAGLDNAEAAPKRKQAQANQAMSDPSSDPLAAPLISPAIMSKLRITVSQRPKVTALLKEFNTKLKAEAEKVQKARAEAAANPLPKGKGIKTKGKKGKKGMKGMKGRKQGDDGADLQDALTLRTDYEEKFMNLLTDAQKKTWEAIQIKQGESLFTGGK